MQHGYYSKRAPAFFVFDLALTFVPRGTPQSSNTSENVQAMCTALGLEHCECMTRSCRRPRISGRLSSCADHIEHSTRMAPATDDARGLLIVSLVHKFVVGSQLICFGGVLMEGLMAGWLVGSWAEGQGEWGPKLRTTGKVR